MRDGPPLNDTTHDSEGGGIIYPPVLPPPGWCNQLLIILDGPDRAGKTTLAQEIQKLAEYRGTEHRTIHNTAPNGRTREVMLQLYQDQYAEAAAHPWRITTIDRAHYSEFAYGHVYRGQPRWSRGYDAAALMTAWNPAQQIRSIFVTAHPETIHQRSDGNSPHDHGSNPMAGIHQITSTFNLLYRSTVWPSLQVDTTRTHAAGLALSILNDTIRPIKYNAWA